MITNKKVKYIEDQVSFKKDTTKILINKQIISIFLMKDTQLIQIDYVYNQKTGLVQ